MKFRESGKPKSWLSAYSLSCDPNHDRNVQTEISANALATLVRDLLLLLLVTFEDRRIIGPWSRSRSHDDLKINLISVCCMISIFHPKTHMNVESDSNHFGTSS